MVLALGLVVSMMVLALLGNVRRLRRSRVTGTPEDAVNCAPVRAHPTILALAIIGFVLVGALVFLLIFVAT
ncbi:hypothetical protein [Microbacterium sp.]|uniref:hypothetical protein n=1 Tax=Microbacterium sp. TaxID=51671 RepID=UPI0039E543BC